METTNERYNWRSKMHWTTMIWLIMFNKRFRNSFKNVILYALRNHEEKHGDGASDVLLFAGRGYDQKILTEVILSVKN